MDFFGRVWIDLDEFGWAFDGFTVFTQLSKLFCRLSNLAIYIAQRRGFMGTAGKKWERFLPRLLGASPLSYPRSGGHNFTVSQLHTYHNFTVSQLHTYHNLTVAQLHGFSTFLSRIWANSNHSFIQLYNLTAS